MELLQVPGVRPGVKSRAGRGRGAEELRRGEKSEPKVAILYSAEDHKQEFEKHPIEAQ